MEKEKETVAKIEKSKVQCQKFAELFTKYGKCHDVFNSAKYLDDDEISTLGYYFSLFPFPCIHFFF